MLTETELQVNFVVCASPGSFLGLLVSTQPSNPLPPPGFGPLVPPPPPHPPQTAQPHGSLPDPNLHQASAFGHHNGGPDEGWKVGIILGTIAFALVMLIIGIACGVIFKRRKNRRLREEKAAATNVNISVMPSDSSRNNGRLDIPPPSYPSSRTYAMSESSFVTKPAYSEKEAFD